MGVIEGIIELYGNLTGTLPDQVQTFLNLLVLTLIVVVYAVFIWKFYIFISTRDILRLNLNKYNKAKHPSMIKLIAGILYIVEYIIILPILIFFWFAFFTILLSLLTKGLDPKSIVLISAITIATVRITAYIPKYGETVSSEVAKIVPLTLLAISITNPLFFKLGELAKELVKIPEVLGEVTTYIAFIVIVELALRFLTFAGLIFKSKEKEESKK